VAAGAVKVVGSIPAATPAKKTRDRSHNLQTFTLLSDQLFTAPATAY